MNKVYSQMPQPNANLNQPGLIAAQPQMQYMQQNNLQTLVAANNPNA